MVDSNKGNSDRPGVEAEYEVPKSRLWRSSLFQGWLNRRLPPSDSVSLNQSNIFILPTRQGLYFLILIFFMLIAGINYQNSLVYALAFLLISMLMVSILHTFRNLSGLTIQAGQTLPAFAGEDAEFDVRLIRHGKRTFEAIVLGWNPELLQGADLLEGTEVRVKLFVETSQRGILNPGRMLIQTYYPVGLFRAWSWVDLNMSTVVYPQPLFAGDIPLALSTTNEGELIQKQGVDDFQGLREYRAGDSPRHIAWKSFARTEELLVKEFAAHVDRRVWLDWEFFQGMDREARLSRLCYWVVQLSRTTDEYGLRLPGVEIAPGSGIEHKNRVLTELAMFEIEVG
jgi:uncharacterized protein (DUF58 family)